MIIFRKQQVLNGATYTFFKVLIFFASAPIKGKRFALTGQCLCWNLWKKNLQKKIKKQKKAKIRHG